MHLPPGFDKLIALEAGALVNQAYEQFAKFTQGQPWTLQGDYDNLGVFSAIANAAFPPGAEQNAVLWSMVTSTGPPNVWNIRPDAPCKPVTSTILSRIRILEVKPLE